MALVAAGAALATVLVADRLEQERFHEASRRDVLSQLSMVRARLEGALNARLYITRGLVAHVSTHPAITKAEFQTLAEALLKGQTAVRSIQLAKNTVVTHLYPLRGNEKALGLRLLELPDQRAAVLRALETKRTVVAGPVDLVQGGVAFVSRTPIHLTPPGEPPGTGRYWGLATILIDKDALFREAGLLGESLGLQYALRGKDGLGVQGEVFFGDAAVFASDPAVLDIHLPNGSWHLAAIPVGGWAAVSPRLWVFRFGGGLLILMAAGLAFVGTLYQTRVREREQRQRLLVEVAQRLTAGLDLSTVLGVIAEAAALVFQGEAGFRLVEGEELVRVGATPGAREKMVRERLRIGESISGQVAATGQAIIVADTMKDLRLIPEHRAAIRPDRTGAAMCVPIRLGSRVLGVLAIYRERGHRFRQDDVSLAMSLADQTAIAIENARLYGALRDTSQNLQAIIETSPVPIISMDPEGKVTMWNPAAERVFGWRGGEVLGHPLPFVPEEKKEEHRVLRERVVCGEILTGMEVQRQRKDGSSIDISFSTSLLRNPEGQARGIMAVIIDITERKQGEEALRRAHDELELRVHERTDALHESREHFRRLVETTNAIPWEADAKSWQFTYVGPQAVRLLGYPLEQWYEMDFWPSHIHPDDREYAIDLCEKSSRRYEDYEFEYRMVAADGRIVWIHDFVTVISVDGVPETLRGFMLDITESKQVESVLKKQRAFLRQVIDIDPNFIFAKDREGRFTLVNQAVADAYGTTVEDLIGKTDADFNPNAEEVEFFRRMDLEVMDTLQERFIPEEVITDAQGKLRWLQTVKRPITGEDGTANQVLGSATDITERKRSEEALRHSEAALRKRQKELRILAGKLLSAQEEERRRLARELHDDLTQRLAVLAIEAASLEKVLSSSPSPVCDRVRRMKEQMVKLSADVHGISRQLHPSILDDLGLVSAIESECEAFSERDGVRVTFTPESVPAGLPRDISLCLYRVTQEGLRNIAKHAQAKEAYVTLAGVDGGVLLTIQDRGVGFDLAQTRGKMGLGLDSMEERVRLLQGSLSIHSKPGQGTIIEVLTPLPGSDV